MQCPKCRYEPTLAEMQESPDKCPSCGVYYANALASARAEFGGKDLPMAAPLGAPQAVVIVDFRMSFLSMVLFMVKWAIAAIPAAIILVSIAVALFSFMSGLFGGSEKYAAAGMDAPQSAEQRIPMPAHYNGEFYSGSVERAGSISTIMVRSKFPDGESLYSKFTVDCATGMGGITSSGKSASGMAATGGTFDQVMPDTPRLYIARHACEGSPRLHALLR
ncbi:hypothetical protein D3C78_494940 [compost metagenome]